jgi:hypothetical protein
MAAFYPTCVIGKSTKLQQFVLHTIALLLEGANNHRNNSPPTHTQLEKKSA